MLHLVNINSNGFLQLDEDLGWVVRRLLKMFKNVGRDYGLHAETFVRTKKKFPRDDTTSRLRRYPTIIRIILCTNNNRMIYIDANEVTKKKLYVSTLLLAWR